MNYTLLLAVGFIWGFEYIFTELALESFTSWSIVFFSIAIGAIFLTLCLPFRKHFPSSSLKYFRKYLVDFIIIGFLETTLPWTLTSWSQEQLPCSFTAILIGTVPLFATFLEVFFIKNNRITSEKTIAILLGLLSIFVLVGPKLFGTNFIDSFSLTLPGLPIIAMIVAAMSYSLSLLLMKVRLTPQLSPLEAAHGILIGALFSSAPLFLFIRMPWKITCFCCAPSALWALMILGAICSGIIYIFYLKLIQRTGPSFASATNYVSLTVATFIGIAFHGEGLSLNSLVGLLLILISLWLMRDQKSRIVILQ